MFIRAFTIFLSNVKQTNRGVLLAKHSFAIHTTHDRIFIKKSCTTFHGSANISYKYRFIYMYCREKTTYRRTRNTFYTTQKHTCYRKRCTSIACRNITFKIVVFKQLNTLHHRRILFRLKCSYRVIMHRNNFFSINY
ncbi:hypothetical protein SDC9_182585 [bioreactor metagenome]|uniref:Uncharacterized protein n=1 Tax=bioreactor metagenome TaxID=1076179 RepID=A0A645H8R9_9ZZZZ